MPLRQYFTFVGGVLLAALFIFDAYFPKPPVAERAPANLPVIRIHSDKKWPERTVYDTSLPTIVPSSIASADVIGHAPEAIGGVPAATRIREAFAMLQLPAGQAQGPTTKIREMKPPRPVKIARRRAPAPRVAMARHPQFGWFGENFW
jgi:hypothetical protein